MAEEYSDEDLINCIQSYRLESEQAKKNRMDQNKVNFDAYHLRQDWSHKLAGQSKEFLPKVATIVEQNANMIQFGLMDVGDWFSVDEKPGVESDSMIISPEDIYKILMNQLSRDGFIKKVGDGAKLGMLGGLIIAKVTGKYTNKPRFKVKEKLEKGKKYNVLEKLTDKSWGLSVQLIRHEDYHVDPTLRGLYEMEDNYIDLYQLKQMAKDDSDIDNDAIEELEGSFDDAGSDKNWDRSRETNQNPAPAGYRKQIKITEFWGNILDSEGELIHENVTCLIANDRFVIKKPVPNPYWHQESPFVTAPLMSVPHAAWPKAMMDGAVNLNLATNELFNLLLDSSILNVHGIKQVREDWLADPSQIADGVKQGDTLKVNSSCPPGQKALESVYTGGTPAESQTMISLLNQETSAAMFSNEIRAGGGDMSGVRATAIVESSQSVNNMSTGIIKNLEGDENSGFIAPVLNKAWKVCAQHLLEMDQKELAVVVGQEVVNKIKGAGEEQIFASTVETCSFRAYGLSTVLGKMKEFTKLTTFMQTVFSNPVLAEEFMRKYSIPKYLESIMKSLDIDSFKIEADESEGGEILAQEQQQPSAPGPDMNSQLPQAGSAANQGDMNAMAGSQPASPQSFVNQ